MSELVPDWPVPSGVKAFFTTRQVGFSAAPFDQCNLGTHVGDEPAVVARNRASLQLPSEPYWLDQVHSSVCVDANEIVSIPKADACVTRQPDQVLAVMVADCVPILLATHDGLGLGVVHAGWRGLAGGVIQAAFAAIQSDQVLAWIGPSIGPCHFEVDAQVFDQFDSSLGFEAIGAGKYRMDLDQIATSQLQAQGASVYGGGFCTYCDASRFYSYRRDGVTGRMAGFIWRE